jgi:hypothetical protein
MKLTDLESYRTEIVGRCAQHSLTITLTAEERDFLITLVSPKAESIQKKITHDRMVNHRTEKARARLLSDIDKAIMLVKLTQKLKES